jgi:hypothetical protein
VWWKLRPTLGSTFHKFLLYSKHNVLAGWQRYWHYGIAKQYAAGSVLLALSALHNRWWLAVLLLGIVVRVGKNIWVRREGRSLRWFLNPIQFTYVWVIMTVIDLATFIGWGQAIWLKITGKDGLE